MALRKAKNGDTPTLEQLQAQHKELSSRLNALIGAAARLDPVNDWQVLAVQLAEQTALEKALGALDTRIEAARREAAAGAVAERDAARQERAASARLELERAARRVCDAVQSFDANELAALRTAARELGAVGGWIDPSAALALGIAQAVDRALDGWRTAAPVWLGLPEPPSREAQALAEREAAVALAEQRLDKYRKMRANARHNEPQPDEALLRTVAFGLVGARQSLLRLTEPGLDQVSVMNKSYGGINELAENLGSWHERHNDALRKAQREEAARASFMA